MWRFTPYTTIPKAEQERGLSYIIFDGLFTHAFVTLTGGIFLVAYALDLGASNLVIGLLAAIPPLAELMQIPGIALVEWFRNRKVIALTTSLLSRGFWFLIAFIPFFVPPETGVLLLVASILIYSCFSAVKHCSWKSWMRDFIPDNILGIFFSRRLALSFALGSVLSVVACFFLDSWGNGAFPDLYGYSVIFVMGSLFGLVGLVFLAATPEPRMEKQFAIPLHNLITECFQNRNFNNLLIFLCLWSFAINLAAPFLTVYLIKRLSLDITTIIILSLVSQVCSIFSFHLWGRLADQYSNKTVLQIAGPLFIVCIVAFTFTNFPDPHLMTMPLLVLIHIIMGFSTAGVTLASGNIGLKLAPKGSATTYLGTIGIFTSLSAGVSPIIGGLFVDHLAEFSLAWNLEWKSPGLHYIVPTLQLQHWDFFFVVAALIGFYSIHRLSYVKEVGEVDEPIFIPFLVTFGRDIRNFSTAGGLRSLLRFPYSDFRMREGKRITRKRERIL